MSIKDIKFGNLIKDKTLGALQKENKDTQNQVFKTLGEVSEKTDNDAERMQASNAKLLEAMKKAGM